MRLTKASLAAAGIAMALAAGMAVPPTGPAWAQTGAAAKGKGGRLVKTGAAARVEELQTETARLVDAGRAAEAEPVARQALLEAERAFGENGRETARSVSSLAIALYHLNRFDEAEQLYRRALAICEQALPEDHPDIAVSLNNLATLLKDLNRLDEADQLYRRVLSIREEVLPENRSDIALSLNNLAEVLYNLNRLDEAERLSRRALAIQEQALPENHPDIASSLHNLALVLQRLNRIDEAEQLYRRALAILEQALPENHPDIASSLTGLAIVLAELMQPVEAERLHRRALAILERALPENHPAKARILHNLAGVLQDLNRVDEAEQFYRRSLAIYEQVLPENHPDISKSLRDLTLVLAFGQGAYGEALGLLERAGSISVARENRSIAVHQPWRNFAHYRTDFARGLWLRDGAAANEIVSQAQRSAFIDLQWERSGGAGGAIAVAAARAQADPEVASLARERDEALRDIMRLDDTFLAISSSTELDQETRSRRLAALRAEAEEARQRLTALDEDIARSFPAYVELAEASSLAVEELQPLLEPDEVLVSVTPHGANGFFFAYSRNGGVFAPLPRAAEAAVLAARLRCSAAGRLDPACAGAGAETIPVAVATTEVAAALAATDAARGAVALRQYPAGGDFDLDLAHDLYNRLFPQHVRRFLRGKKLIIAPAPELMGLPWHLLVTEAPPAGWNAPGADRAKAYREAKWLFQAHPSITVLPTVASLRALRSTAPKRTTADRAFLGIGDPAIGKSAAEREAPPMECGPPRQPFAVASAGPSDLYPRSAAAAPGVLFAGERDGEGFALADPGLVRSQPRLADSRCEIVSVASSLEEQGQADLLFGVDATEGRIRELDESDALARYRILHFATHGLLGGELGLGEPGLVLTPPDQASARDDGILTASEISTLTLAAEWVVLSACNTAAGAGKDAEALSGLARSFFYAGAKSLLVSSWPVYSRAAVDITTRTFRTAEDNPRLDRAEALTIAMREVLAASTTEFTAHPSYWAPFFLVGEGSR